MKKDKNGGFRSESKTKVTATETSRKVEFEIPNEEAQNVTAGLIKNNHLRGMYNDYCILNQEFLKYVLTIGLKGRAWEVFIFLLYRMDKENKILLNNAVLAKSLNQTEGQVSKAISMLMKNKIVLRQKLSTSKYEYELNYDILNPQLAFKNKSDFHSVQSHKALIHQESPYIKQWNTDGDLDMINAETGEVFETKKMLK
jgi:predicted transcriptional regulator